MQGTSPLDLDQWNKTQYYFDVKNCTRLSTWFNASLELFHDFLKCNLVKLRKCKSEKKNSANENMNKILQFYFYMRHKIIPRQKDEDLNHQFRIM